ncbi:MAG: type IV pilus secretin PilQ, partial [Myxococcota bacterium]|nr:type IV pilus secretin PilQ [Myxococcota bacterium]
KMHDEARTELLQLKARSEQRAEEASAARLEAQRAVDALAKQRNRDLGRDEAAKEASRKLEAAQQELQRTRTRLTQAEFALTKEQGDRALREKTIAALEKRLVEAQNAASRAAQERTEALAKVGQLERAVAQKESSARIAKTELEAAVAAQQEASKKYERSAQQEKTKLRAVLDETRGRAVEAQRKLEQAQSALSFTRQQLEGAASQAKESTRKAELAIDERVKIEARTSKELEQARFAQVRAEQAAALAEAEALKARQSKAAAEKLLEQERLSLQQARSEATKAADEKVKLALAKAAASEQARQQATASLVDSRIRLAGLEGEMARMRDEAEAAIEEAKASANTKVAAAASDLNKTRAQLDDAQKRAQQADKEASATLGRLADAEQRASRAEAALAEVRRALGTQEATVARLTAESRSAKNEAQVEAVKAAQAQELARRTAEELFLLRSRAEQAESKIQQVEAEKAAQIARADQAERKVRQAEQEKETQKTRAELAEKKAREAEQERKAAALAQEQARAVTAKAQEQARAAAVAQEQARVVAAKGQEQARAAAVAQEQARVVAAKGQEQARAATLAQEQARVVAAKAQEQARAAAVAQEQARAVTAKAQEQARAATLAQEQARAVAAKAQEQARAAAVAQEQARAAAVAQEQARAVAAKAQEQARVAAASSQATQSQEAAKAATSKRKMTQEELRQARLAELSGEKARKQNPVPSAPVEQTARSAKTSIVAPTVRDIEFKVDGSKQTVIIRSDAAVEYASDGDGRANTTLLLRGASLVPSLERTLDVTDFAGIVESVSSYTVDAGVRVDVRLSMAAKGQLERQGDELRWSFVAEQSKKAAPLATLKRQGNKTIEVSKEDPALYSYPEERTAAATGRLSNSAGKKKQYAGRHVDLDFKDADIHNILRLLADVGQVNIVTADDVKGTVTIRMRDVAWDHALDVILTAKGLGMVREGNLIRVAPQEVLDKEREMELARRKAQVALEPLSTRIIPNSFSKAKDVEPRARDLLSDRGKISVDDRTNVIIVQDTADVIDRIERLIRALDTQTPQVLIEARIVEASSIYAREIGIQWGGDFTASSATGNPTGLSFPSSVGVAGGATDQQAPLMGLTTFPGGTINPNFGVNLPAAVGTGSGGALGITLGSLTNNVNLALRLSAMEESGTVRILSSPKILTLDNTEARIETGTLIPYSQISAQGIQTAFKEAKLALEVTPHSTAEGSVLLNLRVTRDEPDFNNKGARGDPTILKREAETQLLVNDGHTAVIGGIYTRNNGTSYKKVPFFSDIPVLGWLFKSRTDSDRRTEMLIFITPRIVNRAESIGG